MPVLHMALDIDGDVYPELYAKLMLLERPEARAERLRLLAASGLAWEAVRLHGAAALPPAAPLPDPPAPRERPAAERAPRAAPRAPATTRTAPLARPPAAAPEPARAEPDFIDLAISVQPVEPPKAAPAKRAARNAPPERPPPPDHVPLLLDVVSEPARAAPAAPGEGWPVTDDGLDADRAAPPPVMHSSRPRSRLLRMKERGLFKNG